MTDFIQQCHNCGLLHPANEMLKCMPEYFTAEWHKLSEENKFRFWQYTMAAKDANEWKDAVKTWAAYLTQRGDREQLPESLRDCS